MQNRRRGFTLLELMVVVIVIGIIVTIALVRFNGVKDKAGLASVKSDIHNLQVAEEAYFADFHTYGDFPALQAAKEASLSTGNTALITAAVDGFTAVVTNPAVTSGVNSCSVHVGSAITSTLSSGMTCP